MAFGVLLVFLAMSLATETERSKKHLSTRGRLCLCADRVLRLPSSDSEASSFVSCEDKCTTESNEGVLSNGSRRHLRRRRDVYTMAKECKIVNIYKRWYVKLKPVDFHESGSGSEWYAQVSWSPFTGSNQTWIGYYIVYFIYGWPRNKFACHLLPKNQTSVNITSSEKKKIISLNVVALPLSWNSRNNASGMTLKDKYPIGPTVKRNRGVTPTPFTIITTTKNQKTVSYVAISIGILVGIALAAGLLGYFLCRKKSSYPPPEFKFHAFIIFNKEDSYWVDKKLLPFLEEKHHFQCCVHYRNFTPGLPFMDSMAESVYNSYKIIAVLSSNFLQSNYCNHELDLAKYRLLNKKDDCLVIIRIDQTDCNKLPEDLKMLSFIDYANLIERPFWKSKLLKFLDVPDESTGNEGATMEQDNKNNNSTPDDSIVRNGFSQIGFDRLNSTISNATEISIVTLNEERLI